MPADDKKFFEARKEGRTYFSKLFTYNAKDTEGKRNVHQVFENSDEVLIGEIEGALCLRVSGNSRKNQTTAVITQDSNEIRRLTLQSFQSRKAGWFQGYFEHSFTFRSDEFARLVAFVEGLKFVNLSNESQFRIDDISEGSGAKKIVDASDASFIHRLKSMDAEARENALKALAVNLEPEDVNLLLGRKQAVEKFQLQLNAKEWSEKSWQAFFEEHTWIFGYGLDYRFMSLFDREISVGGSGTDNRERSVVDFLMTFKDYTVLVEIKTPQAKIFSQSREGRSGTWKFSTAFVEAVSQTLEQKAEWIRASQSVDLYNKQGNLLQARTRDAKIVLVIGTSSEFEEVGNDRDVAIKKDTFELFRRENRNLEVVPHIRTGLRLG